METTTMRIIHAIFCIVLIAFTVVQHNDPDFYFWMPVYGVPAILVAIAAWSPGSLSLLAMRASITVCAVLGVIGTVLLWPREENFWRQEVWWESELAREGMGMMIATVALLLLATSTVRCWSRQDQRKSGPESGA